MKTNGIDMRIALLKLLKAQVEEMANLRVCVIALGALLHSEIPNFARRLQVEVENVKASLEATPDKELIATFDQFLAELSVMKAHRARRVS